MLTTRIVLARIGAAVINPALFSNKIAIGGRIALLTTLVVHTCIGSCLNSPSLFSGLESIGGMVCSGSGSASDRSGHDNKGCENCGKTRVLFIKTPSF